jgi:hypothetical protein
MEQLQGKSLLNQLRQLSRDQQPPAAAAEVGKKSPHKFTKQGVCQPMSSMHK